MDGVLIFDFDGLLVDTETAEYQTWRRIFQEHGCVLPLSDWSASIGTILESFDPLDFLARQLGRESDRETLRPRFREAFHRIAYTQPLMPGVRSAMSQAKAFGLRLALATSSNRQWIDSHLGPRGLAEAFDCVKTSDDVGRVKPHPDLFLAVLEDLGIPPEQAIVLEDSAHGVQAAKNAGLYCIAVPNSVTKHLYLGHADEILDSLEDFTLIPTLARLKEYHTSKAV